MLFTSQLSNLLLNTQTKIANNYIQKREIAVMSASCRHLMLAGSQHYGMSLALHATAVKLERPIMSKTKTMKIVNVVLLILIINQLAGAQIYPKISPALFKWGHKRAAILLTAFIFIHLLTNWGWIKANFLKRKKIGKQP